MSDGPSGYPLPDPRFGPLAPLWQGAAEGQFRMPRCTMCGHIEWYPADRCSQCGSDAIAWQALSGRASLFSWAIVRRTLHKPLVPLGRYVSIIVTIEEDPTARFVSRLVDCRADALRPDLPLIVMFADAGYPAVETGCIVPLFTPRDPQDREVQEAH